MYFSYWYNGLLSQLNLNPLSEGISKYLSLHSQKGFSTMPSHRKYSKYICQMKRKWILYITKHNGKWMRMESVVILTSHHMQTLQMCKVGFCLGERICPDLNRAFLWRIWDQACLPLFSELPQSWKPARDCWSPGKPPFIPVPHMLKLCLLPVGFSALNDNPMTWKS